MTAIVPAPVIRRPRRLPQVERAPRLPGAPTWRSTGRSRSSAGQEAAALAVGASYALGGGAEGESVMFRVPGGLPVGAGMAEGELIVLDGAAEIGCGDLALVLAPGNDGRESPCLRRFCRDAGGIRLGTDRGETPEHSYREDQVRVLGKVMLILRAVG